MTTTYIPRESEPRVIRLASQFPIVAITGPRQSGKSTLAKHAFPDYAYVTLENPNNREFALEDPKGFLATYNERAIIDEAQRVPHLFNYLQEKTDEAGNPGQYILSGSHSFQLIEGITQSLAGRVALVTLLPFSRHELAKAGTAPDNLDEWLFDGAFPRLWRYSIDPNEFYPSYIQTYLERDVRDQANVGSIDEFRRFMRLCAARTGNLLDINGLASETGIDARTAKRWLSVLEASYIVATVSPYYKNFNKRLVKRAKLFFCDTGLVCSLLGIRTLSDISLSPFRGAVFENMVYAEYVKRQNAIGPNSDVWFWQETATNEVDLILGSEFDLKAVEAKSGATFDRKWFKSMNVFTKLADIAPDNRNIVYGGSEELTTSQGRIIPWDRW